MVLNRYLGIDPGDARIGIAVSDPSATYALPVEVIEASSFFSRLPRFLDEYQITHLVVGMPLSLDGSHGKQADRVSSFIEKVKSEFSDIEIHTCDERLTSIQADVVTRAVKRKKKKKVQDAVAASLMLETYLKRLQNRSLQD
ncbi:MAG: Holliday junction resolvase RuvX [Candidatus Lindowbacteria bacterium]|nr:Holliday junction resolvase RuvX [Candidatus Lindowbacteria bacterium]